MDLSGIKVNLCCGGFQFMRVLCGVFSIMWICSCVDFHVCDFEVYMDSSLGTVCLCVLVMLFPSFVPCSFESL